MFGLFKRQKPPSPERQEFVDTIALLLSGFDDHVRSRANAIIDLDRLFADFQRDGEPPIEAGFHATRLILNAFIDNMTSAQREMHIKALVAKDWSDPFCKMIDCLCQVAEQVEGQGRVKPALVRMLTSCTVGRLRGQSWEEAHSAWCENFGRL